MPSRIRVHPIAARLGKSLLANGSTGCLQCSPGSRDRLRWLLAGTKVHAPYRARIADAELGNPPFPEQRGIVAVPSDSGAESAVPDRRLGQARSAEQEMMQHLFTGSVRLPAPGLPVEEPGQ